MAQLHHFCDASEAEFGAVSYLRLSNSKQEVCVSFVIGKARVAPLKQFAIPRLELAAAVLAVRLDKMLSDELKLEWISLWSDSMTVLKYIADTTARFKTYVANSLSIIHTLSKVTQLSGPCFMWRGGNMEWSPNHPFLLWAQWYWSFNSKSLATTERQTHPPTWCIQKRWPLCAEKVETSPIHRGFILEEVDEGISSHLAKTIKME